MTRSFLKGIILIGGVLAVIYFMNRPDGPPGGKVGLVGETDFTEKVLNSPMPVFVDFRSPYCGACRSFRPKFEALSVELDGKAAFFELDINSSPGIADRYGIQSIPTTILFVNGAIQGVLSGNVSKNELLSLIRKRAPGIN